MKPEVFEAERAAIAAFAPYAVIGNDRGVTVVDVPTRSADLTTTFSFRIVYDETPAGDIGAIRVYALLPNFSEISQQLRHAGLSDTEISQLFSVDSAGNHMMETGNAKSGALAVACANTYLSLVSQLLARNELHQLIAQRQNWMQLLPPFGMNSCGYHFNRPNTTAAAAQNEQTA